MRVAKADLTQERLREVLHYDQVTGVFTRLVRTSRKSKVGDTVGWPDNKGYWIIELDGKSYKAHRLAWLHVHGEWPPEQLDHKDTIRHHNWIDNLRPATNAENQQNQRRARRDNSTGALGVSWCNHHMKFKAHITLGGRQKHLGYFDDKHAAETAYRDAKVAYHPFQTLAP